MKTNEYLRWGIVGGVLLTLFIPLIVFNGLFFPFITGKAFLFRILVEIVFALWLILALLDPSVRPKKSLLIYAAGAFLFSLGISVLFSANPDKSFWSNFERMEGWVGIAHVIAYFLVVFSTFTSEKWWKMLWNTTIGVSVIEGLYGVGQLLGWLAIHQGGVRLDGTFGNATYLSVYMLFSFFMTALAWVWWGRNSLGWQIWYGLALLVQALMIFYTATRGTILGLLAGLFLAGCIFLFYSKGNAQLKKWGAGAIVVLLVFGGIFFAVRNTAFVQHNEVLSRIASIATPHDLLAQGSTRFAIWEMAWKGFEERPVFGWGQESFNYVFNAYYDPSLYSQEPWFDRAHDEFIDMFIAGGAVGGILYLSLFALALSYLFRSASTFSPAERGLLTGLLAAYTVNNLVVFDNLMSYVLFFIVLAYIAYRSVPAAPEGVLPFEPLPQQTVLVAAPVIIVVMLAVLYFVNVPGIEAASDIIQGLSPHQEGIETNLDYFKSAIASGSAGLGLQEVNEQLVQFALEVHSLNVGDATFQSEVTAYAGQQMGIEVAAAPNDARLRLSYGSFLAQSGQLDAARTELVAAQALSPKKQQILFELAAVEATAGNGAASLNYAKEAYDLDPSYDTARLLYAAIAIRAGQSALVSSLLLPRFGNVTPDDDTVLQAYMDSKDFKDAETILIARVAADPSAKNHEQLASAYLQAGDRVGAILELQAAIKVDPSFATAGQNYIQQIQEGK